MTRAPTTANRRRGSRGFILIAVLWILAALAALVSIFAVYVINSATAFAARDEQLLAEPIAYAGLELTAYQVTAVPRNRPSHGAFSFRLGPANVAVQFSAESARIDLNQAPKELLAGLFAVLGAREAEAYADRIVGWRKAAPQGQDLEADLYRTAGLHYLPRGAPFQHVSELWRVLGLPEVLVKRALPFVTIYNGQAQVNVLDAAPEVIAALPGMTSDRLDAVLKQRTETPQSVQGLLSLLGPARSYATQDASRWTRVLVRGTFDSGRRFKSEVVIFIGEGDVKPYHVMTWRDDVEEPLL